MKTAPSCHLLGVSEQEPRLGPGEKGDWNREQKTEQSGGVTANKGLSRGQKPRRPRGALGPHRGPSPPAGGQAAPAPQQGPAPSGAAGSSRPGQSARPEGGGAARTARPGGAHTSPPPPRPAPRLRGNRDLSAGAGEREGESGPVATQRPGDVRRLSLVPKVTGWAAGPGTICVCPEGLRSLRGLARLRKCAPGPRAGGGRNRGPFSSRGPAARRGGVCALRVGGRPPPLPFSRVLSPLLPGRFLDHQGLPCL